MREQATVYVIRRKGTKRYWVRDDTWATLADAAIYAQRIEKGALLGNDEEVVPCRLTVLSSRTKRSRKRTR